MNNNSMHSRFNMTSHLSMANSSMNSLLNTGSNSMDCHLTPSNSIPSLITMVSNSTDCHLLLLNNSTTNHS